jgi:putative tricarboxylic transport membrane protein
MLDVLIMLVLGTAGYFLRLVGVMAPPIVLGLILGGIAEQGYVQAILTGAALDVPQLALLRNTLSQVLAVLVLVAALTALLPGWLERRGVTQAPGYGE